VRREISTRCPDTTDQWGSSLDMLPIVNRDCLSRPPCSDALLRDAHPYRSIVHVLHLCPNRFWKKGIVDRPSMMRPPAPACASFIASCSARLAAAVRPAAGGDGTPTPANPAVAVMTPRQL